MSEDLAKLQIQIDSQPMEKGTAALDKLALKAGEAEVKTKRLETAMEKQAIAMERNVIAALKNEEALRKIEIQAQKNNTAQQKIGDTAAVSALKTEQALKRVELQATRNEAVAKALADKQAMGAAKAAEGMKVVELQSKRNEMAARRLADQEALAAQKKQAALQRVELQLKKNEIEAQKLSAQMVKLNTTTGTAATGIMRLVQGMRDFQNAANLVMAALAVQQIVMFTSAIVKLADEFNQLKAKVANVLPNLMAMPQVMQELNRISDSTGVAIQGVAQAFVRLAPAVQSLGATNRQLLRFEETYFKMGALAGVTSDEIRNSMIQLSQGIASGTLRGDELRAVMEQMAPVARVISDELIKMGKIKSFSEFKKAAEDGKITADVVVNALLKNSKKVDEAFAKLPPSVDRSFVAMKNSIMNFIGALDRTINITGNVAAAFQTMSKVITLMSQNMETVVFATGAFAAILVALNFNAVAAGLRIVIGLFNQYTLAIVANSIAMTAAASVANGNAIFSAVSTGAAAAKVLLLDLSKAWGALTLAMTAARVQGALALTVLGSGGLAAGMQTLMTSLRGAAVALRGLVLTELVTGFTGLGTAAITAAGGIRALALGALGILRTALLATGRVMLGFMATMLTNPLTYVVLAIGLVVLGLIKMQENIKKATGLSVTFGDLFHGIWEEGVMWVNATIDAFSGMLDGLGGIKDMIMGVIDQLKAATGEAMKIVGISDAVNRIQNRAAQYAGQRALDEGMTNAKGLGIEMSEYRTRAEKFAGPGATADVALQKYNEHLRKTDQLGSMTAPLKAPAAANDDKAADRLRKLTENIKFQAEAEARLSKESIKGQKAYDDMKIRIEAENEVRQANVKVSASQREAMIQQIVDYKKLARSSQEYVQQLEAVKAAERGARNSGKRFDAYNLGGEAGLAAVDIVMKAEEAKRGVMESNILDQKKKAALADRAFNASFVESMNERNLAAKQAIDQQKIELAHEQNLTAHRRDGARAMDEITMAYEAKREAQAKAGILDEKELAAYEARALAIKKEAKAREEMARAEENTRQVRNAEMLLQAQSKGAEWDPAKNQFVFKAYDQMIKQQARLNQLRQEGLVIGTQEYEDRLGQLESIDKLGESMEAMQAKQQRMIDMAQRIGDAFSEAFQSAIMGTESFGSAFRKLMTTIANELMRMAMNKMFSALIGQLLGTAIGGGGAGAAGTMGDFGQVIDMFAAKGAAFDRGNVIPFARGGVVSQPTTFGMSGGRTGLMGENGHEGILPLTRMGDGKLGVHSIGGGGGSNVIQFNNKIDVHIDGSGGTPEQNEDLAKRAGVQFKEQIKAVVHEEFRQMQRPGGMSNRGVAV